jgi:ppGpp synthetase/RelA/SpoT-type nucleotidyltranferase
MTDYPSFNFPLKEVVRVGKTLSGEIPWNPEKIEETHHIFRVAYAWRNSHAFPMRKIRYELGGKVRKRGSGLTAGRIKRMRSIRLKLSRSTNTLRQMQDLGGCRAIMDDIDDVFSIVESYRMGGTAHQIIRDDDYIAKPKPGGYRSHHIVLSFKPGSDAEIAYGGRRIEVQIRTRLQHVWATAVESVGLIRNEDLKAGEGDSDWLTLFALISSEFAQIEGCPICPNSPAEREERVNLIRQLNGKLKAVSFLNRINASFQIAEEYIYRTSKYFLMQFDSAHQVINITGYSNPSSVSDRYNSAESEQSAVNSVMVEVDKFENLKAAYPNYFLDVGTFTMYLDRVVQGREMTTLAQDGDPSRPSNLSWVNEYRRPNRRQS